MRRKQNEETCSEPLHHQHSTVSIRRVLTWLEFKMMKRKYGAENFSKICFWYSSHWHSLFYNIHAQIFPVDQHYLRRESGALFQQMEMGNSCGSIFYSVFWKFERQNEHIQNEPISEWKCLRWHRAGGESEVHSPAANFALAQIDALKRLLSIRHRNSMTVLEKI